MRYFDIKNGIWKFKRTKGKNFKFELENSQSTDPISVQLVRSTLSTQEFSLLQPKPLLLTFSLLNFWDSNPQRIDSDLFAEAAKTNGDVTAQVKARDNFRIMAHGLDIML